MSQPKTLIILPALNEARNISKTITQIRQHIDYADILVINDGSMDETSVVARAAGAIVLDLPYNVGIGAAVQTGFKYAYAHGYDIVIRNDGDGQHASEGIHDLLQALATQQADMVTGSRFLGDGDYGTPLTRRLGIQILRSLLSRITGQRITDPTSGFAAFNQRAIRLFAQVYPHDYPEPEAIVVLHRSGLSMCEVPVKRRVREHGKSSITATRSAYYMLKVTLAICINVLRRQPLAD